MSLLLTIVLILVVLNLLGGVAVPTYLTGRYYTPAWGGILLLILILYLFGVR